jgi:acetolactate synthase I/III small subunit
MPSLCSNSLSEPAPRRAVLRLRVTDHPGVMTQVCGLCGRRGYKLTAMLCLPASDGLRQLWLEVAESERLPQIMRQLAKLQDVRLVTLPESGHNFFSSVAQMIDAGAGAGAGADADADADADAGSDAGASA